MADRNYTWVCSERNKNLQLNPNSFINLNSSIKINSEKSVYNTKTEINCKYNHSNFKQQGLNTEKMEHQCIKLTIPYCSPNG